MEALFSDQWYRIAERRPRLRASVRVRRQIYRGERWYLLTDDGSERSLRIDAAAYAFIGRCDGTLTAQQLWEHIAAELGEHAPTQASLLRLMVRLQGAGMLHFDRQTDIASLFPTRGEQLAERGRKLNPFSFRIRLGSPAAILRALAPLGRLLFRPACFVLWLLVVGLAALLALFEIDALAAHARSAFAQGDQLWLLALVYPPVKLLHEIAHGLAVRRWSGEVREWGLAMLVLMPVPYVNASAATAFRHARRRATVAAAGILTELFIAALALGVWLLVEPGTVRDVALATMLVCSFSTLLVNGNPLLRFDGYFVLTDLLELPNLATRSGQWWRNQLRHHLQGLPPADEMIPAPRERPWLIAYQPLSWLYRVVLIGGIVLWLGGIAPWLAVAVGAWFLWLLVLRPLVAALRALFDPHLPESTHLRSRALGAGLVGALALALFIVPVSDVTVADGVAWLPDDAHVRNDSAGFVAEVLRRDGDTVRAGDAVLRLDDEALHGELTRLESELDGLRSALFHKLRADPTGAGQIARRIEQAEREHQHLQQQIDGLTVRARKDGTLSLPRAADLPGRHLARGTQVGAILDDGPLRVRIAVPDGDATRVSGVGSISVQLAEARGVALPARIDGHLPGARRQLPSAALGRPAGGRHDIDPSDPDGLTSLAAVVWVDLVVHGASQQFSGGRAWARFEHPERPLAAQLWRKLQQLVLGRFQPEAATWR